MAKTMVRNLASYAVAGTMLLSAGCGALSSKMPAVTQGTSLAAAAAAAPAAHEADDDVPGAVSQLVSAPGLDSADGGGGDGEDGDINAETAWEKANSHLTPALRLDPTGDPVDPFPGDPLNGVYHPQRLHVQNPWTTMSGTVSVVRKESDKDWHVDVMPDPQYQDMINSVNTARQGGALVVEVIPNDQGNVRQPKSGDHIQVWGPYVLDGDHGWEEIHPVRDLIER